jgi:hypothetical protein
VPASCQGTRFVVLDSHRPVHPRYNNGDDTDALLVLAEDDPLPKHEVPPANEALDGLSAQGESGRTVADWWGWMFGGLVHKQICLGSCYICCCRPE